MDVSVKVALSWCEGLHFKLILALVKVHQPALEKDAINALKGRIVDIAVL